MRAARRINRPSRSEPVSVRLTPETVAAADLVAAVTSRTLSSLMEHALRLYIEKNYPEATRPGAKLVMRLDEAPLDRPE